MNNILKDTDSCNICGGLGTYKDWDSYIDQVVEYFCDCIGSDGEKQWALKQRNAKRVIDAPESPRVTLVFKDEDAKQFFMGQLCDGWGEDRCALTWIGDFDTVKEMYVEPFDLEEY